MGNMDTTPGLCYMLVLLYWCFKLYSLRVESSFFIMMSLSTRIKQEDLNKRVIRLGKPRQEGSNRKRPVLISPTVEHRKWVLLREQSN